MKLRQSQSLSQIQTLKEVDPDEYIWLDLGWFDIGVSNDEGYSKQFISVGKYALEPYVSDEFKIDIVQIIEKFYYTNSQESHHEDEQYFEWNGKLVDYTNKKRRNRYA